MLAFVQMSRGWVWAFAIVIVALFVVAAIVPAAPNLKKYVNVGALALAVWAFFYFYALLASANQSGEVVIDPAWWAARKKATYAFLTVIVTELTALLAAGVLPDPWAGRVATFLAAIAPLLAFLGVKASPANKPLP